MSGFWTGVRSDMPCLYWSIKLVSVSTNHSRKETSKFNNEKSMSSTWVT